MSIRGSEPVVRALKDAGAFLMTGLELMTAVSFEAEGVACHVTDG